MTMDEPSLFYQYNRWFPTSPRFRMSWDQPSNIDDRVFRSSLVNTPQRNQSADADSSVHGQNDVADNAPPPSPYLAAHPYESLLDPPIGEMPPYGIGPEFATSMSDYAQPSSLVQDNVTWQTRDYELCEPDLTHRTRAKRPSFELSLSHSSSPGSDDDSKAAKKFKMVHDESEQERRSLQFEDPQEEKTERFYHSGQTQPSMVAHAPHHSEDIRYHRATRMYAFNDSALMDPNAGQDASPISKLPVQQASRSLVTTSARAPPKPKRSDRRGKKKSAKSRRSSSSSSSGESTRELQLSPTERELDEAGTARAQAALRTWYERFGELVQYKNKHGNCLVPQKHPDNPSLGTWVNKQRMEYKVREEGGRHSMTNEKLQRLESIGFEWGKRKGDASWEVKFQELCEYKDRFGNCKSCFMPKPQLTWH